DSDAYNRAIGPRTAESSGAGLLPVALRRAVTLRESDPPLRLRVEDWTHAAVADLAGHIGGGLLTTPIRGYVQVASNLSKTANGRTIISCENGDPALIEVPHGRGRVLLWTGSMQMDWSSPPAKPDFVPLVMNMVAYAAGDDAAARNVRIGEPMTEP